MTEHPKTPLPDNADVDRAPPQTSAFRRRVLIAFFDGGDNAELALSSLMELDFPLDRISLVGKVSHAGDDPLGVYYASLGERMRGWGQLGAFWGGIFGLLGGAAGLFLMPGFGSVIAAGPLVQSLAGAATGAAVGGAVLAGSGAAAQLTSAIHRMGIPDHCLAEIQERLAADEHMLMLILDADELESWRSALREIDPQVLWDLPYAGLVEGVREAL